MRAFFSLRRYVLVWGLTALAWAQPNLAGKWQLTKDPKQTLEFSPCGTAVRDGLDQMKYHFKANAPDVVVVGKSDNQFKLHGDELVLTWTDALSGKKYEFTYHRLPAAESGNSKLAGMWQDKQKHQVEFTPYGTMLGESNFGGSTPFTIKGDNLIVEGAQLHFRIAGNKLFTQEKGSPERVFTRVEPQPHP